MSIPLAIEAPATSAVAPILSAEVFVVALDTPGRWLVYAPLRQAAFVANARTVNFLADLQRGVFDASDDPDGSLVEFLRHMEILDAGPEDRPITIFGGDPHPTVVTLFLTTACNLRCTYCYASAGDTPVKSMPLSVAIRGIDFICANAVKKGSSAVEVLYHGGGEPTANWRTLTGSLEYARTKAKAHGLEVKASTATNGVLSDAQIDWIVANLEGVSLSFDGSPSVHDKHRPLVSGKGSSDRVLHTLRRFDEAQFRYGIRVTVTADQIASLPDSIDYICTRLQSQRIQVEPAFQMGRWHDAPSAETQGFIDAYREAQRRAAGHGKEIFYSAARVGLLTNHFCGITQDTFSLSPDGNVSACYEVFSEEATWSKVFFYGQPDAVSGGYNFNLAKLDHLRGQTVEHREYCRGCYAKWHCAGDCYYKSLTEHGATEFQGSGRYNITREITKDQILAKIGAAGGLFWHEARSEATAAVAGKEALL